MTEIPSISCVYSIQNNLNGKFYIGSTDNLRKRWNKHLSKLRRNKHENDYLQSSWEKYGEKNFEIKILEELPKEEVRSLEQEYLNIFYDNQNNCYNMLKTTCPNIGQKHTEQSKQNISKSKLGTKHTPETIERMRKASTGRFHSQETKDILSVINIGKNNPNYGKTGVLSKKSIPVYQYDLNGNFIAKYNGLNEACRITGVNESTISRCVNGILNKGGNYIWSKEFKELVNGYTRSRYIKIFQISIENNLIIKEFSSVSEAAKYINGSGRSIRRVIEGTRKKYKGFFWKAINQFKH